MPTSLFYPGDLTFQPGLKFHSDYMRFFSPFAQAEISSPASKTGLEEKQHANKIEDVVTNIARIRNISI